MYLASAGSPIVPAMKPWEELTDTGKIRRLRPLASAALTEFPIVPQRLRSIGGFSNAIFRVDAADRSYVLRIDLEGWHSDEDAAVELAWLEALAADTDIDVCRFVPARDGRRYVHSVAPGVPGSRRCVLFEWIPGRPLAERISPDGYRRLGRLAAALHRDGAGRRPAHWPLTWDRVFYWPEDIDPVVIHTPQVARFLSGGRAEILEEAITIVGRAFARLDWDAAQIIHGDLHPWNVHSYRDRLIALDFEDVTWGHRVQDVAITLFYERDNERYPELRAAFEEGYREVAPWPVSYDGELEHFMAARTIMFVNFVANLRSDPSEYYEVAFPRLAGFVERYGG
jgi:Ser/Thr protein kinase RdoA (MazF antagonist)